MAKDDARIQTLGDVDELNAHLGLLLCEDLPQSLKDDLITIQHDLFDAGGELSIPGYTMLEQSRVARLDALLEQYNADLPALKEFILPGGSRAAAQAHVCRTVCRRAERSLITLERTEPGSEHLRQYLNRLSDLLFVLSRTLNRLAGIGDVLWNRERLPNS